MLQSELYTYPTYTGPRLVKFELHTCPGYAK